MKANVTLLKQLGISPAEEPRGQPSIIAVGDVAQWKQSCGRIPNHDNLCFFTLEMLDRTMLELYRPELIVSPVVAAEFDCIDVAGLLARMEYDGAYRAIARDLPDKAMICREVRGFFPRLDFDICEVGTDPRSLVN